MKRILLFLVIAMLARGGDFRWEEWHGKRIQASRGELRRLFFLKELPVLATARFRTDGELYVNDRPFGPIEGQGYRNLRSALRVGENELLLQLHEGGESSHGVELLLVFADGEQRLVLSDYGWDLQTEMESGSASPHEVASWSQWAPWRCRTVSSRP